MFLKNNYFARLIAWLFLFMIFLGLIVYFCFDGESRFKKNEDKNYCIKKNDFKIEGYKFNKKINEHYIVIKADFLKRNNIGSKRMIEISNSLPLRMVNSFIEFSNNGNSLKIFLGNCDSNIKHSKIKFQKGNLITNYGLKGDLLNCSLINFENLQCKNAKISYNKQVIFYSKRKLRLRISDLLDKKILQSRYNQIKDFINRRKNKR